MAEHTLKVDYGALKANQLVIIALDILAFIFDVWPIAALVALAMAAGTFLGKPGFLPAYRYFLAPLGLVKREVVEDDPRPHRFAQGFGAVVMVAGTLSLALGNAAAGWTAVWIVVALAAVNAFGGFCAGCFVFYQLARIKFPGFAGEPPAGVFPGTRQRKSH